MTERFALLYPSLEKTYKYIENDVQICKKTKNKVKDLKTTGEEFKVIQQLNEFLVQWRVASKLFETQSKFSICQMFLVFHNLIKFSEQFLKNDLCDEIVEMVKVIKDELNERMKSIPISFRAVAFFNPSYVIKSFFSDSEIEEIMMYIKSEIDKIESEEKRLRREDNSPEKKKIKVNFDLLNESEESEETESEVIEFLREKQIPKQKRKTFDVMKWWKNNSDKYPKLSKVAQKLLCIPSSSSDCERDNSFLGRMITEDRNSLETETVSKLNFIKKNL